MKKKNAVFFWLFFTLCFSGFSQSPKQASHSYSFHYYGMREGLAQSQVFTSFQDSYGYLWFSTNNGVSRFDGKRFENYSPKDLRINGRVKYFNQYKQAVYMVSSENIVFVYPDQTKEYYPLPDDYRIYIFGEEIQMLGTGLYLFNCYSPENDLEKTYTLIRFDLENKTFTRLEDNLPRLWSCVSGEKLYAAAGDNRKMHFYRMENERLQLMQSIDFGKTARPSGFRKSRQNDWFISIEKGSAPNITQHFSQCVIEHDSIRIQFIIPSPTFIRCIERLDNHRFLLVNHRPEYPLSVFDTETGKSSPFPLSLFIVNDLLRDDEGNWWFSTEEGVYQCPRFFFETYRLGLGHNDNIWGAIKAPDGNVWFSSFVYGFWRMDAGGGLHPANIRHQNKNYPLKCGYMGNCTDSRGRIFQTSTDGLIVFDPQHGDADRLELIRTGVSLAVYPDTVKDLIFFGGDRGDNGDYRTLHALHPDGKITTYPFDRRFILTICRDAGGKLRIGTFSGEAWLDEEKGIVVNDTVRRPYKGVIAMALDEKGFLWKGTESGLFVEDRQGKDRQISGEAVNFVLPYKNQYLLRGTTDKLYILDLPAFHRDSTLSVRMFGSYAGFDMLECGQNGASVDSEGYVWVAGGDKTIRFLPEQLMSVPPLQTRAPYLAAIYNANKNDDWSLTQMREDLVFANRENYLRFDVLQASASAPDQLIFRYRLNGYNENWYTTRERSFIFQNIPYGKYRLEVQSSLDEQSWSESAFSPRITIQKPFLLTFPGLAIMVLGIGIAGGLIVYYTRKISIRKEEEMRRLDRLKHRAVQSKFIPHFTGNVLNSINYLITKKPDLAQQYIVDFAGFSLLTLQNSEYLYRTLREELDYAGLYLKLEKLRFEEKLAYSITVAPEVDTQKMIPTMVLQTFCENALKHGLRHKPGEGTIKINACIQEDYLVVSVEDNGIGREKARSMQTEGTKEGLKIVWQQLDICNKHNTKNACYMKAVDLFDNENQPAGTRFELHIHKIFIATAAQASASAKAWW